MRNIILRIIAVFSEFFGGPKESLSHLITESHLDWVHPDINEINFPIQPGDLIKTKKEFKKFNFGKIMSSDDVITEMYKEGFRPATTREQLKWVIAKNWDTRSTVVALGQNWVDPGGFRLVSGLRVFGSKYKMNLAWLANNWSPGDYFLGVKN